MKRAEVPSLRGTTAFYVWSESIDSFLAEIARGPTGRPADRIPEVRAGHVVAARYRLARPLGRGGNGIVWVAEDAVSGASVALKLLTAPSREHATRIRAEVASLRKLRATGVVRLLDEGADDDVIFIVMSLVGGTPFPGRRVPAPWTELRGPTLKLLDTLARVHAHGVVHRDLKPANVLVNAAGEPTVLDFGLSVPQLWETPDDPSILVGTPAYLAPEQLDSVASIDARTDLFSVGVMLYHSLSGSLPHDANSLRALLFSKFRSPPSLASLGRDVPRHVAHTVDALLAIEPNRRPSSAIETIERLRDGRRPRRTSRSTWPDALTGGTALTAPEIGALFAEQQRLSHVPEDVGRLLLAETRGEPGALRDTLSRWLDEQVCRWEGAPGSRLILDRMVLDQLEVERLEGAAPDSAAAIERALEASARLASDGRLGLAYALLARSLRALRAGVQIDARTLDRVLGLFAQVALADGSADVVDRVLYELCRVGRVSPLAMSLERLLRAALSIGPWTERALDLASDLPPFEDRALELWRHSLRVVAARRTSFERERELLGELSTWAEASEDAATRARFARWLGRLRYREGRYAEASTLHGSAAELEPWRSMQAAATVDAASAAMEAFDLDRAATLAARARDIFRACRLPHGLAQATWFSRTIAYRRGEPLEPDVDWVDAMAQLGFQEFEGISCVTEAAIAWRGGESAVGRALAERGVQRWTAMGETAGALLLSTALQVACERPGSASPRTIEDLTARAIRCPTPGVGLQVVALIARHSPRGIDTATELALATQVPRAHWNQRIDVLSVDEARDLLERNRGPRITSKPDGNQRSHPPRRTARNPR